jgi:uncharacterized tellurite resistance protein B-like protein
MSTESQVRLLLKILIGIAWLDGEIQPEERVYLSKIAHTHQLDGDAEISLLLAGSLNPSQTDCEHWIETYRSLHGDDGLLEAISGIIYSDGEIAISEAQLLVNIQPDRSHRSEREKPLVMTKLRGLYRNWLNQAS